MHKPFTAFRWIALLFVSLAAAAVYFGVTVPEEPRMMFVAQLVSIVSAMGVVCCVWFDSVANDRN